jgi:hypothetical protein
MVHYYSHDMTIRQSSEQKTAAPIFSCHDTRRLHMNAATSKKWNKIHNYTEATESLTD